MADKPQSKPSSLSEISHLFLTELRQRQTSGGSAPSRKPPAGIEPAPRRSAASLQPAAVIRPHEDQNAPPRMSVVLGHHLGNLALQSVREYARHLAAEDSPIGLIELGDDGMRLTCFDLACDDPQEAAPPAALQPVDGKQIREALAEMSWDVRRWLLYFPAAPQSAAARTLLKQIPQWTLLVASADEAIVAAYRTLKGLAQIGQPSLSLAVVGAEDNAQAELIHRKFAGASKQFLNCSLEPEGCVQPARGVAEQVVLWCRAAGGTHDHWTAVSEMAAKSVAPANAAQPISPPAAEEPPMQKETAAAPREADPLGPIPFPVNPPPPLSIQPAQRLDSVDEVVDLPLDAGPQDVLASILKQQTHWIASPVKPPNCPAATVAVDRNGSLTLLAATGNGLGELGAISRAYGWLIENRPLIRMALPQMNIDASAMPKLTLFVDQADAAGDELSAILQNSHVTLQTYRRLRWGEKTGLLLKAA